MAQGIYGYLPIEVQKVIADTLDIPLAEVAGVVTFYSVSYTHLDVYKRQDQDRMRQALAQYEFYDPIANRLGADYRYSGVEFSGPKNVKFEFKCSPTEFSGNRIREADPMLGPYDLNYDGSDVYKRQPHPHVKPRPRTGSKPSAA